MALATGAGLALEVLIAHETNRPKVRSADDTTRDMNSYFELQDASRTKNREDALAAKQRAEDMYNELLDDMYSATVDPDVEVFATIEDTADVSQADTDTDSAGKESQANDAQTDSDLVAYASMFIIIMVLVILLRTF